MEIPGYKGQVPWLSDRTIFLTKHGSHAYGLATATSDLDIKGVAIAPRSYYLGFSQRFEQAEAKDPDLVVYEVRKFFQLAADCNPNIIEVLFTDSSDHLGITKAGELLIESKELFLSKKARHTFAGFAMAQLKRLQTHYRWIRTPLSGPPSRSDFQLPEKPSVPKEQLEAAIALVTDTVNEWTGDGLAIDEPARHDLSLRMTNLLASVKCSQDNLWITAANAVGLSATDTEWLHRERLFKTKLREWEAFLNWKKSRNPARSALEDKFGYDTKFGAHVVRLFRMCREILETSKVVVKRPDREELLAIRTGLWSYEQLVDWATTQDKEMEQVYHQSTLPHSPNRTHLDSLCEKLISTMI